MNIIVKKRFLEYKGHKFKCSIGKSGYSSSKKEGDLTTPRGIFKLGAIYFRKDRIKSIKTKIKKKIIKKNMGWCDDSLSKEYNQEIKFPYKYSAEKLFRKDKFYDIFINVKYNQNPAKKNRGSAIFLHLTNEKYKPTKGCIAILKKNFLKILPLIDKKTKISIT
ncbi:MAG: transpeptidase [Candidatus Pelagibacterales bacterium]|nr:MAG: transpeptidase [Pelagibacterales bacterium]